MGMFMAADIVVKAVMVGLAFASVLTWTIWFAKTIELMFARRRMRVAIEKLSQAKSWNEANVRTKGRDVGVAAMLRAADTELRCRPMRIHVRHQGAHRLAAGAP